MKLGMPTFNSEGMYLAAGKGVSEEKRYQRNHPKWRYRILLELKLHHLEINNVYCLPVYMRVQSIEEMVQYSENDN